MEKIVIFFCGISGAYYEREGKDEDYKEFAKKLNELKKHYGADKIIFSFTTYNRDGNYLIDNIRHFKKYNINNNIEFGRQYYSSGYVNGKCSEHKEWYGTKEDKIERYLEHLKQKYIISKVIYADARIDLGSYYNIQEQVPGKLTLIIPGSDEKDITKEVVSSLSLGLSGVNKSIGEIINQEGIITKEQTIEEKRFDLIKVCQKIKNHLFGGNIYIPDIPQPENYHGFSGCQTFNEKVKSSKNEKNPKSFQARYF